MDPRAFPSILPDWSRGRGPLYNRLASSIREAIRRGLLSPGLRLPSERDLARALGVSRTTVVSAYAVLRDDGVVETTRGSGTRVLRTRDYAGPAAPAAFMPELKGAIDPAGEVVDCSVSVVSDLPGVPPELVRLTSENIGSLVEDFAYEHLGLPALRNQIAHLYASRGIATNPEEILVTTGAQQAIGLLFTLFGRDGGTIVVENPTYVGALDVARAVDARVVGVPIDQEGVRPRPLRQALDRSAVRLVYVMSGGHNPTGNVASEARRRELARAVEEAEAPLVDDMTLADLVFDGRPRPPLAGGDARSTIAIGSMSKLFWAGLRIGWIRAPAALIGRLARLKLVADLGSSHVSQVLAARLLSVADEVAAIRRRQLAERLDRFEAALRQRLPSWSWTRPRGGPFLWVRLPFGDGDAFSNAALRHGVRVLPGRRMSPDDSFADHLRISYVADPDLLRLAAERLEAAWNAFGSGEEHARTPHDVVV